LIPPINALILAIGLVIFYYSINPNVAYLPAWC
jgi:hypothetical protein